MTKIVEAFLIELGFKTDALTKGEQETVTSIKRMTGQVVQSGKTIDKSVASTDERLTGLIGTIQKTFAAFAVFMGGESLARFAFHIAKSNAEVGYLSKTLGMNVSTLSAWRGAAVLAGGARDGRASRDWTVKSHSLAECTVCGTEI